MRHGGRVPLQCTLLDSQGEMYSAHLTTSLAEYDDPAGGTALIFNQDF